MEISSDAPRRRRAGGELHPSLCTAAATPRREATVRVAASRRGGQEPGRGVQGAARGRVEAGSRAAKGPLGRIKTQHPRRPAGRRRFRSAVAAQWQGS